MAALTDKRDTPARGSQISRDLHELPVAATAVIHQGALIVLDATGFAEPGTTALNLTAVGRAEESVDNSGGADGDVTVKVRSGIFRWANDGGDAVVQASYGADCFVLDDQTVSNTDGTGTQSKAGKVYEVDSDGVWVATIYPLTDA